ESWTFFAGGVGSLLITLWFLVVLFKFPKFLKRVRNEGAEADVVVRLTTFDELNRIRVGFRFFFAGPLLILAVDGILPGYHPINTNQFWTDLLSMVGGIGCIVSSILTLLIFFPRSIAKEAGYKAKTVSLTSRGTTHNPPQSPTATYFDGQQPGIPMSPSNGSAILHQSSIGIAVTTDPVPMYQPSPTPGYGGPNGRSTTPNSAMMLNGVSGGYGGSGKSSYPYSYGHGGVGSEPAEWEMEEVRRHRGDVEAFGNGQDPREYLKLQSEQSLAHVDIGAMDGDSKHPYGSNLSAVREGGVAATAAGGRVKTSSRTPVRPPRPEQPILHPLILNYTSPIDLMDQTTSMANRPSKRTPRRL
ncbi:hypothetical protein FRC16_010919, partial [Serendipita sp. 398]